MTIVDQAERALRAFSQDLTHRQAVHLLPLWSRYASLTERDRVAVLSRFGGAR